MLEAEGLDALLVTSRPNIRYLTGFSGSAGVAVVTRARSSSSPISATTSRRGSSVAQSRASRLRGRGVWDRLLRELPTLGTLGVIGFEAHALSVRDAERFSTGPGAAWRWKAAGELVEKLRVRKGCR